MEEAPDQNPEALWEELQQTGKRTLRSGQDRADTG